MITILNCVAYDHDLRLLGFAAAICVFGCFTSVMLLHRAVQSRARSKFWLIAAGTILGCSVWSLHFVAMLAYMPGLPMAFDAAQTAFSIVVAVSGAIASIILWRRYPGALGSITGGVGIGLSVAGMHYVGVNAMRFVGLSWFDYRYVSLSIIASLAFATIAFERTKGIARSLRKAEVTAWLSLSICSLHFIGMAGLTIVPTADVAEVTGLNSTHLAIVISAFALVFLVTCFVAIIFENHLTYRTHRELSRMRLMNDLTQEALIVHRDGRVLEVNSAGTRLIGSSTATIEGKLISDLFAADDVPGLTRRSQCDPERRLPEEYSLVTRDQRIVPVEFSCRPIDFMGKPATVVALRDLSGRKRNEERINYLAHYDALTGALNRVALHDRLALETELASDRSGELALLYLDLDRF